MPARRHILVILAFWIATSGWLFYRDLRPLLRVGEPPSFAIDLADEAQAPQIRWAVLQVTPPKSIEKGDSDSPRAECHAPDDSVAFEKCQDKGYALTNVTYREADDAFDFSGTVKLWPTKIHEGDPQMVITSAYRVTRAGEIRGIWGRIALDYRKEQSNLLGLPLWNLPSFRAACAISGEVAQQRLTTHLTLTLDNLCVLTQDLDPVEVSQRGSVLNPLLPVNRIAKLRKGQHWQIPVIDPREQLISSLRSKYPWIELVGLKPGPRFLQAEVLAEPEYLTWNSSSPRVPCLIIKYSGEDIRAYTWVRQIDGLVLQQEVTKWGDTWILKRS
jgi:hypothetical protein